MSGGACCTQETGHATIGGNTLEELLGPLDASCTEAAVQGSSIPGSSVQAPADSGSSSDQEKSIVPVSALNSSALLCDYCTASQCCTGVRHERSHGEVLKAAEISSLSRDRIAGGT